MNDNSRNMPRAVATKPPQPAEIDIAAAAWWALPLPIRAADTRQQARPHMAVLADFVATLAQLEAEATPLEQRLGRLDMLELALSGAFGPAMTRPELEPAVRLRESLLKTGGSFQDMMALADACRDTITGNLPHDTGQLHDHAARASAPVLRHFLLLHGERDENLATAADALARAWYLLRLMAASNARPEACLPEVPPEMLRQCLQAGAPAWQLAADAHVRSLLLRLQRQAEALARLAARQALRLKTTGPASSLPPATVLSGRIGPWQRLRIALAARMARKARER